VDRSSSNKALLDRIAELEAQLEVCCNSQAEAEERLEKLLSTIPDPVTIIKADTGICINVNDEFLRVSGWSREEIVGQTAETSGIWVNPEERDIFVTAIRERGAVHSLEADFYRKDRTTFTGLFSAAFFTIGGYPHILSITRDISRRKKAEEENINLLKRLERARKMEALGLLAGGVAHDLNNIFTSLVAYPDLLLHSQDLSPEVKRGLEIIRDAGYRASAVVQDLLTITRGPSHDFQRIELNTLITDCLQSPEGLRALEDHPLVTVVNTSEKTVQPIEGSSVHIRKSLVNLIMNAMEAIEGRGAVTIAAANRSLEDAVPGYDTIEPGEYVVVSISDTGTGIAEADKLRIFEPFYTRKAMGRSGTGLGLTMVWNAVHEHGGCIDLHTGPGGTTFELYFPVCHCEKCKGNAEINRVELLGDAQRVLVVDDEDVQRGIAEQILGMLNYRVDTASCGERAIEMIYRHQYDLVVLDMIMDPGIDGLETFRKLRDIQPGLRAIIVSGYAENEKIRNVLSFGAGAFLPKPYTVEQLGLTVRDELARKA